MGKAAKLLAFALILLFAAIPAGLSVWPFSDANAIKAPAEITIVFDAGKNGFGNSREVESSGLSSALTGSRKLRISSDGTFFLSIPVPIEVDESNFLSPQEPGLLEIKGSYSRGYLTGKFVYTYEKPATTGWKYPKTYRAEGDFYTSQIVTQFGGYGKLEGKIVNTFHEWKDDKATEVVERTVEGVVNAKWYKANECKTICGCFGDEYTGKGIDTKSAFDLLTGQVSVIHCGLSDLKDEEGVPATMRTKLYVTDHVFTLEDSYAHILFSDKTDFKMGPNTEIIMAYPPAPETKLGLVMGNVWINTKKILTGGSMEIEMGQAVAGIKGTTFVLEQGKGATSTVKVIEGTVNFTSKADGKSVLVNAGEMSTATLKGAGPVEKFDAEAEKSKWANVPGAGASWILPVALGLGVLGAGAFFFAKKGKAGIKGKGR